MSRINIAFGTLMGGGEPLDEGVPFSPDLICPQCLAILENLGGDDKKILRVDPHRYPRDCRLCAVLIAQFHNSKTESPLEIVYFMVPRYGYFIEVHDIVFHPVGAKSWNTNIVRLSLQMTKLERRGPPTNGPFQIQNRLFYRFGRQHGPVANWFKECSENHARCKAAFPKTSFVPSRLIEISGSGENSLAIRLRERHTLPADACYATLSHCWGPTMPFKLKLELLDSCLKSISPNELSKVFRDAIKPIVQMRRFRLTAAGIIQDSLEDWISESTQMDSVYHHGILNIAATGFPDGTNGLFVKRDPNLLTPIAVSIGAGQSPESSDGADKEKRRGELRKGDYYLVDTSTWKDGIDESPLCERGWVTQERALSVRTIHFGKQQLFWECLCQNASEVFPRGLLRGTTIKNPKVFLISGASRKEKRIEKLQSIRESLLKNKKASEEFLTMMKENHRSICGDSGEEDDSDEGMSDKAFATHMKALQNGQLPTEESSESSDSDSSSTYEPAKRPKRWKPSRPSISYLGLSPQDFDDCDLNTLDGLGIKGWKKLKTKLENWGIGAPSNCVEPRPIRGMAVELSQWVAIVEIFSRCSLSFSKDKLVAISGMAQTLGPEMRCDYLAGLWRRDLEHQLLWKVNEPCQAPKENHTRGPSWTWASVDGAIEIPEWRGYFYDQEPGDINWLARVDHVSVQLAETGQYGQVRSGLMTMTGRLGVFRIDKETVDNPAIRDVNGNLISTRRWVAASWDTQELEARFGKLGHLTYLWRYSTYDTDKRSSGSLNSLDVFYLPVRVMGADASEMDGEAPMLTGLLFLPTGNQKGLFRRVGQFELSEQWIRHDEEGIDPLTKPTGIFDNRFFVSKHKRGQYTISIV